MVHSLVLTTLAGHLLKQCLGKYHNCTSSTVYPWAAFKYLFLHSFNNEREIFTISIFMSIHISVTAHICIALNWTTNLFVITDHVNNDCSNTLRSSGPWNRDRVPWMTNTLSDQMKCIHYQSDATLVFVYYVIMMELHFIHFKADCPSWGISKFTNYEISSSL